MIFTAMMFCTVIGFVCGVIAERLVQKKKISLAEETKRQEALRYRAMQSYMSRDAEATKALYDKKYGRLD